MSTSHSSSGHSSSAEVLAVGAGDGDRPTPRLLAALVAALLGVGVYAVGLPSGVTLFGTPLADLTVPAALLVALGGTVLAGTAGVGAAGVDMSAARRWRVVDIVVAAVLGVAGGLVFAVWNVGWAIWSATLLPPLSALFVGVWLFPAVLGMLVIRKPGAAVFTELVAAVVSALIGNLWGFATVWYGLIQGLGAEVVFALLLYRRFGAVTAVLSGIGAGVAVGLLDTFVYYPALPTGVRLAYLGFAMVSGAVIAGAGSLALTRALAATGALAPLASGRTAERV